MPWLPVQHGYAVRHDLVVVSRLQFGDQPFVVDQPAAVAHAVVADVVVAAAPAVVAFALRADSNEYQLASLAIHVSADQPVVGLRLMPADAHESVDAVHEPAAVFAVVDADPAHCVVVHAVVADIVVAAAPAAVVVRVAVVAAESDDAVAGPVLAYAKIAPPNRPLR